MSPQTFILFSLTLLIVCEDTIEGGVLFATYDKNGRIFRTAEKYNNVALPKSIGTIVGNRFPNWKISKDGYLVNYYAEGNLKNIKKTI